MGEPALNKEKHLVWLVEWRGRNLQVDRVAVMEELAFDTHKSILMQVLLYVYLHNNISSKMLQML